MRTCLPRHGAEVPSTCCGPGDALRLRQVIWPLLATRGHQALETWLVCMEMSWENKIGPEFEDVAGKRECKRFH